MEKNLFYSLTAKAIAKAVVSSQVRGQLNLQPRPTEDSSATATTSVSEVSLPESQDTSMLLKCTGTLWFCATWLGDSLSENGSNENVSPHQKLADECKRMLMTDIEQTCYQLPSRN